MRRLKVLSGEVLKEHCILSILEGNLTTEKKFKEKDNVTRMRLVIDPVKGMSKLESDHGFWDGIDSVQKTLRTAKKKRAEEQRLKREARRKRNVRSKRTN